MLQIFEMNFDSICLHVSFLPLVSQCFHTHWSQFFHIFVRTTTFFLLLQLVEAGMVLDPEYFNYIVNLKMTKGKKKKKKKKKKQANLGLK